MKPMPMNSSAAHQTESNRPQPSPEQATQKEKPRKTGKRIVTPLGFSAGSPCPRVCGGVLEEMEGAIRCNRCDFRYPASESAKPALRLVVQDTAPVSAPRRADDSEEALDAKALATERDALLGVVQQLKEENRRLLTMVYQLMSEKPATKRNAASATEATTTETQNASDESANLEDAPSQPEARRAWWRLGLGTKRE
jgi:hypothetical protein